MMISAIPSSLTRCVCVGSSITLMAQTKDVPDELVPRLKEKCQAAGIDWSRFRYNDNRCMLQVRTMGEVLVISLGLTGSGWTAVSDRAFL